MRAQKGNGKVHNVHVPRTPVPGYVIQDCDGRSMRWSKVWMRDEVPATCKRCLDK